MDLKVPKQNQGLSVGKRKELAEYAAKLRKEWEKEREKLPTVWDSRRRKHVKPEPKWGYIRRTIDENFPALKGLPRSVSVFPLFYIIHCNCYKNH